jgi:large subunit ribosomal protein L24
MQKLKVDDEVIVLSGKDKGKTGKILVVNIKKDTVLVKGINMVKKTMKGTNEEPQGRIFDKEAFLHISNVSLVSPKTKKATRVRIEKRDGKNCRVATSCGSVL